MIQVQYRRTVIQNFRKETLLIIHTKALGNGAVDLPEKLVTCNLVGLKIANKDID